MGKHDRLFMPTSMKPPKRIMYCFHRTILSTSAQASHCCCSRFLLRDSDEKLTGDHFFQKEPFWFRSSPKYAFSR